MKFQIDHDLHIHSQLSSCSSHPEQTTENILKYGVANGLKTVCITDHHWDMTVDGASNWYKKQGDIFSVLPLPQDPGCRFLFGCETDMDKNLVIGLSKAEMEKYDFFIVPTTHLHMKNFTYDESQDNVADKTNLFIKRFEAFLNADLPFHKVGLAHITCHLMHTDDYLGVLRGVSDECFEKLFSGCAERGCGVELNVSLSELENGDVRPQILRPYKIAKNVGCKFYLGSDSHSPDGFSNAMARFNKVVDLLELTEDDKFVI